MLEPLGSSCCTIPGGTIHIVTHLNRNLWSCAVHTLCSVMQQLGLPILKYFLICYSLNTYYVPSRCSGG